jgi:hypothetical protein
MSFVHLIGFGVEVGRTVSGIEKFAAVSGAHDSYPKGRLTT